MWRYRKVNPGPRDNTDHNLSICHWNLNCLATNNYIKLSLLEAFNTVHDFDIICLGETFLNSENSNDDPRLKLQGYAMVMSDHPQKFETWWCVHSLKGTLAFCSKK